MSSLMSAIRSADLALMSELLADAGTDVNGAGHLGTTPLAVAVKTGQLAALRLLLAHPRIDTAMADHFGTHALIWAVKAGDTAGVELLLAHDQGSLNAADALGRWVAAGRPAGVGACCGCAGQLGGGRAAGGRAWGLAVDVLGSWVAVAGCLL
jgi:ankyrin repeat protein